MNYRVFAILPLIVPTSVALAEEKVPDPDPVKTRAFVQKRLKNDPAKYKASMALINRIRLNRLVKRELYGDLKSELRAIKKKGWIPQFDFRDPIQHAIGRVKSTENGWVSVVPKELVSKSKMVAEVYYLTVSRKKKLVKTKAGLFTFHVDTEKFLVGRVAEFEGEFIAAGDPRELRPFDRMILKE